MPTHTFEDHVGEIRLRLDAPTLALLFEEAARALAELTLEKASSQSAGGAETIALRAPDRERLLVD